MTEASLRVLIVEDHVDTLSSLKLYLEQSGHEVQGVRTLAQAIAVLPSSGCDVLISDVALPDGSGWDLLRSASPSPSVYAIAMSGFGTESDLNRSRAAGFRHHIVKPVDPDILDKMIAEAVRERHAHD
jgi:DNA-binding response OmpR family regulator